MKNYLLTFLNKESASQFTRLAVIGGFNTVVDFALFNVFLSMRLPASVALAIAFILATGLSYFLNRRWTFRITGTGSWSESSSFYLVNLGALLVSEVMVIGAERLFPDISRLGYNIAKVAATAMILFPKFAAYRDVVFRRSLANVERS